jgi:dolichol-phosphate mannosyltransferase
MLSIVLPIFNEQENIPSLYARIQAAMKGIGMPYEVLAVDDGSTDGSLSLLKEIHAHSPNWKVIAFSRNFGHQVAVSAGLYYCTGDVAAVLDADLQDPPEQLGRFLDKWREGYQVVYAIRTKRKESLFKRAAYATFYRLLHFLSPLPIPLDSGDFCIVDRVVLDVMRRLPERTRFVRGLRTWAGFRQIGLEYERDARYAGDVKYTLPKLFKLAMDGLVSFSTFPLRLASWFGICLCFASFALVGFILFWWTVDFTLFGMKPRNMLGWTSLSSMILFLSGIQMLFVGIIGEYLARVFDEVKAREPWVIGDAAGIDIDRAVHRAGWFAPRERPGLEPVVVERIHIGTR